MSITAALTVEACWHRVPGGTATSLLGLVRGLEHVEDVNVVGVAARHQSAPEPAFALPASVDVRHTRLPRRLQYEAWHRRRGGAGPRVLDGSQLVHATGGAIPPTGGRPLVVTMHDLAFRHRPEHFTRNGRYFFEQALRIALDEADAVICPSSVTRQDCEVAGFDADRLHVIPWGVEHVEVTETDVARVRARFGLDGPYVLWVGTLEPRKNVPNLLDAYARLGRDDVTLALVGPAGWHENIAAKAEALGDRVRLCGFVAGSDLAALYAGAAFFCFPSLLEGFGMPVLEAMAQATPVVTSAGTSTAEVAGDAALLVDPTDIDSIADAMARLLEDRDLAATLAERGHRRAEEFSWDGCAQHTSDVYRGVLP